MSVHKMLVLAALAADASLAHSAGYSLPRSIYNEVPAPPPPAISYHIHIVFDLSDPTSLPAAIALRDQSRVQFS